MSDIKLSEWCKDRNTGCSCGNKFAPSFIKKIEALEKHVEKLQHYRDTTINLWATDRPDLISDPKKIMFQLKS